MMKQLAAMACVAAGLALASAVPAGSAPSRVITEGQGGGSGSGGSGSSGDSSVPYVPGDMYTPSQQWASAQQHHPPPRPRVSPGYQCSSSCFDQANDADDDCWAHRALGMMDCRRSARDELMQCQQTCY